MDCNNTKINTIYRIDYTPKSIKNLQEHREKCRVRNIIQRNVIADSYKSYLYIDKEDEIPNSEHLDEYCEKAKKTYPWFDKVTGNKPVEKSSIQKYKIFRGRTIYQVDYCDLEKDIAYKEEMKRNAVKLPLDIQIPLTTQNSGYRNPIMLDSKAYDKSVLPRPPNSLDKDDKLRDLLHVTTGDSEYMKVIGKLGNEIMEDELHGVITRYEY